MTWRWGRSLQHAVATVYTRAAPRRDRTRARRATYTLTPTTHAGGLLPDDQAGLHPLHVGDAVPGGRPVPGRRDAGDARAPRGRALRRRGPRPHRDAARHALRRRRGRRDGARAARHRLVAAAAPRRLEPAALPHVAPDRPGDA